MSGIGLVFNPRAGGNKRDPAAAARLARKLGDHGTVAVPRDLDELSRAAEDFRRQGISVLGIAGGDGTNHVTLTHFHEVYGDQPLPTVAFLRGGTMNTVANSLNLPRGRPEGILDRLVRRYTERSTLTSIEQRMLSINGKLGFLWGVGVIPAFLKEYYDTGAPSPATAARTLAHGIASAAIQGEMIQRMCQPVEAEVTLDGQSEPTWAMRPYFSLGAGTIQEIGLSFKPFHLAGTRAGAFHLQGITTTPLGLIADLPLIFQGKPMGAGKASDALTAVARVRVNGPRISYMIDGDLLEHEGSEMVIRTGPVVRLATMT
jgi:diacylglycerol kinase family enzyme